MVQEEIEDKKFNCLICNSKFKYNYNLTKHLHLNKCKIDNYKLLYDKLKPFYVKLNDNKTCFCNKTFTVNTNLTRHLNTNSCKITNYKLLHDDFEKYLHKDD